MRPAPCDRIMAFTLFFQVVGFVRVLTPQMLARFPDDDITAMALCLGLNASWGWGADARALRLSLLSFHLGSATSAEGRPQPPQGCPVELTPRLARPGATGSRYYAMLISL
jgi:hypothetical protein